MKLSLNWLKDFVSIPKNVTPEALASKLMLATTEIEGMEKRGEVLDKLVVGFVKTREKHPNADRLSVTKVDIGGGKILNIVCGAPNVAAGQKVVVALPGVTLPNGLTLERREVRGIVSEGMICSEDEIGLGPSHSGILVLNPAAKIGAKVSTILPTKDVIYEIDNKSLSHRSDLWGHYGMAREVAAILGQKFKVYKVGKVSKIKKGGPNLEIKVQNKKLCPRYIGAVVENIKIGPSPAWLAARLESVGVRSINNIVDITNYVMLEFGQPLHAFDFEKVEAEERGKKRGKTREIIVREAKNGESIVTIDGVQRKLDSTMLVIADALKPVAIAGVMGGATSEIDDKTTSIILESANFDFISVRKTSMRLGLRTEASIRFEKGLDPNFAEFGMSRALELIAKIIPEAKVNGKIIDVKNFKLNQGPIKLSFDYLNKKIGEIIPSAKVLSILKDLGFEAKKAGGVLSVKIPTWRATKDIGIADDLVEEIVRIYGYENISSRMPEANMAAPEENLPRKVERVIKNILARGLRMTEVYNHSFAEEKVLRKFGFNPAEHIKLKNSINKNLTHLRQSLIPGLVVNMAENQYFSEKVRIFEMGKIFFRRPGELKKDGQGKERLPQQDESLAGMILKKGNETPFYEAKEVVAAILDAMHIKYGFEIWQKDTPLWANPARTARIVAGGKTLGIVTELAPAVQQSFGVRHRVGVFGINLLNLVELYSENIIYRPIPKYPAIELDLALIVLRKTIWDDVAKNIFETEKGLVKEVKLFDVYEGRGMEPGKKSLAFRIVYRSDERTLKLEEAKKIEEKIIQKLNQKFGAKLRA
ncbi:phenylalanine--tRNA ligase subunit beta [Candidatus Falkowbacteria bacterium]|nr:phenylalanine--tRNA ligase subunit beta [Candidatus Falkowbacteria bacterium]